MDSAVLHTLLPHFILAGGAIALLMGGVFATAGERTGRGVSWLAIGLLVAALVAMFAQSGSVTLFEGALISNAMTRFLNILILVAAAMSLLLTFDDFGRARLMVFEYPVLVVLATLGMLLMVSANDLIALYLGLEMQNLALYVITAFKRDNVRSSEAGLKYFVLSALASGLVLYGASLIYGVTGSTGYAQIAAAAAAPEMMSNIGLTAGLVFVLVGLAFKISAVPFHMWTPDVYQGAPTPVTAFLASAAKVAAMALVIRFVQVALPGISGQWQQIIIFVSIASMALGAFAAIGQTNIKRLFAYSAIGNIGFALVGLAANSPEGTAGVLIYLAIYVVMTLGAFACVLSMRREGGQVEDISDLAGLASRDLPFASVLALLMFSLAGIPPLAGFWAKWYTFLPAIQAGLYPLAVIGVVTSVVGAFYYLRIIKIMFFDEPAEAFVPRETKASAVMMLSAVFVLAFVLPMIGGHLVDAATAAAAALTSAPGR
ncbi:NADH-quinone oxidoreductase subunit NuoN [Hyphomicrobium methylovorum]|uniref:NADH-quinone oxidoreductase subunit NuoN n=1 Tax=Hyphomicrobium methylovorum TaxID=84 RepID=UPI0015E7B27B|nr:NADH-quinone oxidoreductase subunit NuoN [Hyphomicrobium methylovorum]MBA2125138.1 NADH-quinone oxidoreductase subunit NuoN [Hyphomicrobium methylovorum]